MGQMSEYREKEESGGGRQEGKKRERVSKNGEQLGLGLVVERKEGRKQESEGEKKC